VHLTVRSEMSVFGPSFESKVDSLQESFTALEIQIISLGQGENISEDLDDIVMLNKGCSQLKKKKEKLQNIIHRESLQGGYNERAKRLYDRLDRISVDHLEFKMKEKLLFLRKKLIEMERVKELSKSEGSMEKAKEKKYLEDLEKASKHGTWYDKKHMVGGCAARFTSFDEYLSDCEKKGKAACIIAGRGLCRSGIVDTPYPNGDESDEVLEILSLNENYQPWHIDQKHGSAPDMCADLLNERQMEAIPDNSVEEIYLETLEGRAKNKHILQNLRIYKNTFRKLKKGGALIVDNNIYDSGYPDSELFMIKKEQAVIIRKAMREAGFMVVGDPVIDHTRSKSDIEKIIAVKKL
jgi:hypothetical protein